MFNTSDLLSVIIGAMTGASGRGSVSVWEKAECHCGMCPFWEHLAARLTYFLAPTS